MRFSLLRPPVLRGRSNYLPVLLFLFPTLFSTAIPLFAANRIIPEDVAITAFVKPAGAHLQLLIRVPLVALNEVRLPVLPGNGYMDLPRADSMLPGLARYWIVDSLDLFENESRLSKPRIAEVRVAMPADKSFASFDEALAHLTSQAQSSGMDAYWNQAWLDVLLEYPIHSDGSEFSIRPRLAHLGARVSTNLKFLPPDGTVRPFEYQGDPDVVRLAPHWTEVASLFFRWGFAGVLGSTDYLLIVCCLVLPLRRIRAAAPVACGFVCAGALTLFASAAGLASDGLWFHPLNQTLIAVAILVAAAQNIAGGVRPARRALEALVFGLIFGFDFSFSLAEKAQFGGAHGTAATIAFGVGAILSLLAVFAVLPPLLRLLFHFTHSERAETVVLSMLAAHASWHWMTERWEQLSRFPFGWPVADTAFLAMAMRWMMILVIFGGAVWFASGWFTRTDKNEPDNSAKGAAA
jgi:hypothetical protein